jgi:hypothetical protein
LATAVKRAILVGVGTDLVTFAAALSLGAAFLPLGLIVGCGYAIGSIITATKWCREKSAEKVMKNLLEYFAKATFKHEVIGRF